MASIWRDTRSKKFLIKFNFGGNRYLRSCRTKSEDAATRIKILTEDTLALLHTGRLRLPDDVIDTALWIMSGGKANRKPVSQPVSWTLLGETCDAYLDDQLHKASTTLVGERVHVRHLKRLLGDHARLEAIDLVRVQAYVNRRLKESNRSGLLVAGKTVKKELLTFTQVWDWARLRGVVRRACPVKDPERHHRWAVSIPLPDEPENFMPWDELERRIARFNEDDPQKKRLWRFLYLDEVQRDELLEHVRRTAAHPFIYPMFAIAAFTGARRSEICRSLVEDFRIADNVVVIREKKRRKDRSVSTREAPMHPRLREIIVAWLGEHPGGRFTITAPVQMRRRERRQAFDELGAGEAHHHFKSTLLGSKWSVVSGFHVLRHSFGAICARHAIPMSVTGKWMGHSTEEMMVHYQHLFPQDEQLWMQKLG